MSEIDLIERTKRDVHKSWIHQLFWNKNFLYYVLVHIRGDSFNEGTDPSFSFVNTPGSTHQFAVMTSPFIKTRPCAYSLVGGILSSESCLRRNVLKFSS